MDNEETGLETPSAGGGLSPQAGARGPSQTGVQVDDSRAYATYANFCRVIGTPEELILDFGLNPQTSGAPTEPVVVNQRIITNLFTAKRLLGVLQMTLERHEGAFGAVETDVQRRVTRS